MRALCTPERTPDVARADGTVQVWQVDLADPAWDLAAEAALLTGPELARARLAVPAVQRRRVLLRASLRRLLGRCCDLPPQLVPLGVTGGRPHLDGRPGPEVSCSASGDVGLVALSWGAPVGVDVQRHDDREAAGAFDEGWLTPAELAALAALPPAERLPAVTRCWTQKEAVLKGLGVGLSRSPATVGTPVAAAGRIGAWAVSGLDVPAGHLASLAVLSAGPARAVPVAGFTPGGDR